MIAIFLYLRFPKWWCKWDRRTKPMDQWKPSNFYLTNQGPWSYGMSWIYISVYYHLSCVFKACSWRGVLDTTAYDKVCQWLAAGRWFSPSTSFSKITYRRDIIGILLKMALRTITLTLLLIDYASVVSKCYKSICRHFVSGVFFCGHLNFTSGSKGKVHILYLALIFWF